MIPRRISILLARLRSGNAPRSNMAACWTILGRGLIILLCLSISRLPVLATLGADQPAPLQSTRYPAEGRLTAPAEVPSEPPVPPGGPLTTPDCGPWGSNDPVEWTLLMCDTFEDNANTWDIEKFQDDVSVTSPGIANGMYTWDVETTAPFRRGRPVNVGNLANFFAAVDTYPTEAADGDIEYGLQFRIQDPRNYYLFAVSNTEVFVLLRVIEGESSVLLIDDIPAGVLELTGWNRLAVRAVGPQMILYINDREIGRASDPFVPQGGLRLSAQFNTAGRMAIHFDNIEVRLAPADVTLTPTPLPPVTTCPNSPAVAPADWPLIACDPFDDARYGWRVAEHVEPNSTMLTKFGESSYFIMFESSTKISILEVPQLPPVTDFFVSTRAMLNNTLPSTGYGLIFRMVDDDNYFAAVIDDNQQYWVYAFVGGFLRTLLPLTKYPAIRPREMNTVSVKGERWHFTLYINDEIAAEWDDIHFRQGKVGLAVAVDRTDMGAVIVDDFELRTPP